MPGACWAMIEAATRPLAATRQCGKNAVIPLARASVLAFGERREGPHFTIQLGSGWAGTAPTGSGSPRRSGRIPYGTRSLRRAETIIAVDSPDIYHLRHVLTFIAEVGREQRHRFELRARRRRRCFLNSSTKGRDA